MTDPGTNQDRADTDTPSDPIAEANAQTAIYNAQKAAADAQKAQADAQKAAIDAQAEAIRAKYGNTSGTAPTAATGAVDTSKGGGKAEASLLVSRAAIMAANDLATAIQDKVGADGSEVLILTDLTQLSTSDAVQFDFQAGAIKVSFDMAEQQYASAK